MDSNRQGFVDVDTSPIAFRRSEPVTASIDETIVFLHGLGTSRTSWDPQLQAFGKVRQCIAWDAPGYGVSPSQRGLSFADYADAVTGLLDELGVESATVVGLSFGGQVAMHVALRHPHRVQRLVLADTSAAFGGDGTDPEEWKRLRLDALDNGQTPADIARAVLTSVGGPGLTGDLLETAIASMSRITSEGLRTAVECLPSHDVRSRLGDIVVPTLVIVGENDTETPLAYSQEIAAAIPNAHLVLLEAAGHLSPIEQPDAFNAALHNFLQE